MRKLSLALSICFASILTVMVMGCGQETVTVPSVVSTIPTQGATNVAINTLVSATFNMPMKPSTFSTSTFSLTGPDGKQVAAAVTYSGLTATLTPAAPLAYSSQYRATIRNIVTNLGGVPMATSYAWSFTTITPPPVVVVTIPVNGAQNVPVSQVLNARFNEAMNPATISSATFLLTGPGGAEVAGTVTYSGVTATFTPASMLAYSSLYTATITSAASDLAGTPLATNYVWHFTTITPPPYVVSTIPVNTATGVPITQVLSATFNEAMNCTTLATAAKTFTLAGPGATPVAGTVGCEGNVATFTPGADLLVNTLYTATITTGAKDLAGTPIAAPVVWTFRTLPAPTPPTVISTVPLNMATGVPTNQAISATFSVAMDPASTEGSSFLVRDPDGTVIAGTATYVAAGSVVTFVPAALLQANAVYTATITTGAMDLAGTPLAQDYVWKFTTAAAIVITPPTVISTIPANLATNVPLAQVVSATFSKAMNPATINAATFSLTGPGATIVPGLVAYASVGNTLTFTPAANLPASTLFTATITTGVTDLAGNPMAHNYTWTFTTGTGVVVVPPELVSTIPANHAIDVPLNQAISGTFTEAMNPLTLTTATVQLTGPGGTTVAGTVSYDPINFIVTITPTLPLIAATTYTATITNGATDLVGDPLGNTGAPDPWTFTTGSAVIKPPVILGTASLFGAFGGAAGITNQGIETVINGDIGTTGVSTLITGFHDTTVMVGNIPQCVYTETPLNIGQVNGSIATAPPPPTVACPTEGTAVTYAVALQGAADALAAYNALVAFPNGLDVSVCPGCGGGSAGELGNRTLAPGIYKAAPGSFAIDLGDLTLDAKGDPNAFWVFQMSTTLTVGTPQSNRNILLVNGAQAKNVFWQVGSAATINGILGGGTFQGTIIAQDAVSISTAGVVAITTINGRAEVLTGPVTMVNTVINVPAP